jgi:CysZ protein
MYLGGFWPWDWGKETFETLSTVFGGLVIISIGFLIFKHLVLAFSAPFMGPISERIEIHLTGVKSLHQPSSSAQLLVRGLRIAIRNILRELLLTIPILLIGMIPIIGVFSTILLFFLQSYYAGFGSMDYTLERHFNYQGSIKFVKRNKGLAIGNGIVFVLFLLIPIVGIIFVMPFSVTAATSETIKKIRQE